MCVWEGIYGGQSGTKTDFAPSTVELHLSGLIGTTSHPDMQKIRIIGFFFFKIGYIGSLKWGEKDSTNGCSRLHIYLRTKNTLIHNSLYVFDTWGGKTKTTKKDAVQFFSSSSLGAPTSFFECFGLLNI